MSVCGPHDTHHARCPHRPPPPHLSIPFLPPLNPHPTSSSPPCLNSPPPPFFAILRGACLSSATTSPSTSSSGAFLPGSFVWSRLPAVPRSCWPRTGENTTHYIPRCIRCHTPATCAALIAAPQGPVGAALQRPVHPASHPRPWPCQPEGITRPSQPRLASLAQKTSSRSTGRGYFRRHLGLESAPISRWLGLGRG